MYGIIHKNEKGLNTSHLLITQGWKILKISTCPTSPYVLVNSIIYIRNVLQHEALPMVSRRVDFSSSVTPKSTGQYSKTCLKWPLKKKTKNGFQGRLSLNAGQSIAECILQYFLPSFSYHLSLISLFCLFLSGSLRQVLLSQ